MERQRACSHVSTSQEGKDNKKDLSSGFLNVQEIANYLELRKSSIYSLVEKKGIPHYRLGRLVRFKKAEIDEWMKEQKEELIDIRAAAKKVLRSIEKRQDLDINRTVEKTIEGTKKERYTSSQEKPGRIEGLRKEVEDELI